MGLQKEGLRRQACPKLRRPKNTEGGQDLPKHKNTRDTKIYKNTRDAKIYKDTRDTKICKDTRDTKERAGIHKSPQ